MKIAFINPNMGVTPKPHLGLLSLATVCESAGYEVKIIDANLLNLSPEDISEAAADFDVICLTAMTPNILEVLRIAELLEKKTLILGGVHASIFPDQMMNTGLFDAVVIGEGESIILQILSEIKAGRLLRSIYKAGPANLDTIQLPDYSLIELSKYKPHFPHGHLRGIRVPWASASTSRGCPYNCTFCSKAITGRNFHAMKPDRVVQLFREFEENDIQDITFYDDLFTANKERVQDICNKILDRRIKISWTCESRVSMSDSETLWLMNLAGCRLIYYGIESGNQYLLDNLKKGITLDQIRYAVKVTKDCGIQAAGYFMIGIPGETKDSIKQTVEFAQDIGLDHAQFSVCSPLPGSQLYQEYIDMGYPVPTWDNFKYLGNSDNKPMFTSEELSRDDIENAVKEANEIFNRVRV